MRARKSTEVTEGHEHILGNMELQAASLASEGACEKV